eukprot:352096-Chlamydomonas_euryale.AAC.2
MEAGRGQIDLTPGCTGMYGGLWAGQDGEIGGRGGSLDALTHDGCMSWERGVQNVWPLAAFCPFENARSSQKLSTQQKMDASCAFVWPVF